MTLFYFIQRKKARAIVTLTDYHYLALPHWQKEHLLAQNIIRQRKYPMIQMLKLNSFAAGDISSKKFQDEGTEFLQLEWEATSENVANKVVDASGSATIKPSSSLASAAADVKLQDRSKEGKLVEKTMSVIGGGEIVQAHFKHTLHPLLLNTWQQWHSSRYILFSRLYFCGSGELQGLYSKENSCFT